MKPVYSIFKFLFVEKLKYQKDEFSAERWHNLFFFLTPKVTDRSQYHSWNTYQHHNTRIRVFFYKHIFTPINKKKTDLKTKTKSIEFKRRIPRWHEMRTCENIQEWEMLPRKKKKKKRDINIPVEFDFEEAARRRRRRRLWEKRERETWGAIYGDNFWCYCLVFGVSFLDLFISLFFNTY